MLQSKKGFTLVETMIVLAVVTLVSGIGVTAMFDSMKNMKKEEDYQVYCNTVDGAQKDVHNILKQEAPKMPGAVTIENQNVGNNGQGTGYGGGNGNNKGQGAQNGNGHKDNNGNTETKPTSTPTPTPTPVVTPDPTLVPTVEPTNGNGDKENVHIGNDGNAHFTVPSGGNKEVQQITIYAPGDATFKDVWNFDCGGRYTGKKSADGKSYTITFTADAWANREKNFPKIQFNLNESSYTGKNVEMEYSVEYK